MARFVAQNGLLLPPQKSYMISLSESLYLAAGAFDLFPDAIIVVDKNGIIRNSNRQVESVFGYTESEVNGKELIMLLPDRFKAAHPHFVGSFFYKASIRKMGAGMALFGKHKLGHEINIDIALSVINTNSEQFALAVIRDISDKLKLVNQITSIEKIKTELEQFAYVLTHDLKAPLQRVKMLTHLINLELSEKESDDIKTIINYLNDSVQGMESLIYGVLDYHKAKLEKNETVSTVNLNEIFSRALNMMVVPENVLVESVKPLPVVEGNETMLLQIFMNLIYNAVTHNEKEKGIIQIDWQETDNLIEISVADNGTIIPEQHRELIFELSTQLNPNVFKKSHGLGLSIVKQIVTKNKGSKIWYEPSSMGGSCFKFTWPYNKDLVLTEPILKT